MAQIIKHRRGSLEALSAVTSSLQKGELVIASGSSNLSVTNGASIVFAVPENGQVQAVNRFLVGNEAPNTFAAGTYNGLVKGVPYYASGSSTLYLLGEGANDIPDLTGNISNFSSSVSASIAEVVANVGAGAGVSITNLNSFSSSQLTQNNTLATYTGSVDTRLTEIGVVSGSLITSASNAKTTNDSQDVSITNLNSFSGSQLTQNTALATITGSLISSASTAKTTNDSQDVSITNLNSTTASLNSTTASLNTSVAELNTYSSSLKSAITVDGQNVTIAGNFTVSGTTTTIDSTTVQIGDNIIELNGTGAANGGLLVKDPTAPNTVSGSLLWDSTNDYWKAGAVGDESKLLRAEGDNVVSGAAQIFIGDLDGYTDYNDNILLEFSASNASITALSASVGAGAGVSITNLNLFTSSINTTIKDKLDVEGVISGSSQVTISSTTGFDTFSGSVATSFSASAASVSALSASVASVTGDFSSSVATSFSASAASQTALSSSFATSQVVQDGRLSELETKSGSVDISISNLNSFTSSINTTIQTKIDSVGLFSGSSQTDIAQTTGYSTFSGSIATSISASAANVSALSASIDGRLDTLEGTGTIQGVGTSNNVTFAKVTTTGDVVVGGDLVVQGNTVTLNTATLIVEDKLITLASGSTSSATADGSGFEVAGADANFVYQHSTTAFTSSVALIAPAVTSSFNLGSAAGSSKRVAFRNTNGNLDLVPTASIAGDLLQWNGTDFVMSNVVDGGSF